VRRLWIAIGLVAVTALAAIGLLLATTILPPAPTAQDDDFGTVRIYTVTDAATLDPEAAGLTAVVWHTFVRVTTAEVASEVIAQYRVGDAPDSDTLAFVYQSRNPKKWVLADNLATSEDYVSLVGTLVHEYGHILTLGVDEVDPKYHSCTTLELDEGCADDDSAIWAFEQQFWAQYGDTAPGVDNDDSDVAWDFYQEHEDDFVDDYAATNVVEDIAESFMTWVVEDDPSGTSVVADKLAFFEDYPELVQVRDRIRAEFAEELGLSL
jgi:hypothetical protein